MTTSLTYAAASPGVLLAAVGVSTVGVAALAAALRERGWTPARRRRER